jgi:hypothetical protein
MDIGGRRAELKRHRIEFVGRIGKLRKGLS